jgi:carboxyl-terminal processing protease
MKLFRFFHELQGLIMQNNEPKTAHPATARRRAYSTLLLVTFGMLQVLIVLTSFTGGFVVRDFFDVDINPILPISRNDFPLVDEAYALLRDNAYFPLPEAKQIEYGMIRGMLQAYNEPHTVFVEPPQHELQTHQLQGRFGGIGVRLERDSENYVYLFPFPDSPAMQAGVQDGDRLLQVESLPVTPETSTDEIQAAIRGPVGEKVRITVGHEPDYIPDEVIIERAEVALPSVTWNLAAEDERVGIIHLNIIADTTPDEVSGAIEDLQERGATHFILDVRNNGGGLVEAGVNTARLFLQSGIVIEQQYRGKPVRTYEVDSPGPFVDLPLVVLVNGGTASAAEIFAGSMQGQQRAKVVGIPTYGKDSIQLVFSLSDGSSLHVTSAQWWVPGLEAKIGEGGIQPDVLLPENAVENQDLILAIQTVLSESTTGRYRTP